MTNDRITVESQDNTKSDASVVGCQRSRHTDDTVNVDDRRQFEDRMNYRLAIEAAISHTSQLLLSSASPNFYGVLTSLARAISGNRTYIFRVHDDVSKISNTYEWCDAETPSKKEHFQNLDVSAFPWWQAEFRDGNNLIIDDVDALSIKTSVEKTFLEQRGIQSLIIMPIYCSDLTVGLIGIEDTRGPREWQTEEIRAISIVAEMIATIWQREESERVLSQTIAQYTAMIDTVPALMYLKGIDHRYISVNESFCRHVGKTEDEIIGFTDGDIYPPERADEYSRSDQTVLNQDGPSISQEVRSTDADGNTRWMSVTKVPVHDSNGDIIAITGLVQDITDRHENRERLIQADKLAAIGTLAAGVAHEINNPMGFIGSNLNTMAKYVGKIRQFIEKNHSSDINELNSIQEILEDFSDAIEESIEGATRVKQIVTDLKSFSRVDHAEKCHANLNDCLESTLNIVWNELKYKCKVEKEFGDLPDIYCVPNQLNQVFLNMLVNAGHAIEDREGIIWIRTWADEEQVHVSIRDNGIGMTKQNINRIFDPFFTTKDVGKGTGLGLSLAFDIIKKHGGTIDVNSEVGIGTEFVTNLSLEGIEHD